MEKKKKPRKNRVKKDPHRPLKQLDWSEVDLMLESGCPGTEIANHFNMHPETFYRKVEKEKNVGFTEYCASKKLNGINNIRKQVYTEAMGIATRKGNTEMLKLLAMEWLSLGKKNVSINGFSREDLLHFIMEENESNQRIAALERSSMENESSLLDKGSAGKQNQVSNELGAKGSLGKHASMQTNSEGPTARYNDVFLPPLS